MIFAYILKSAICMAIYYLFYKLLLSRDTFYRFNRGVLLSLLLASLLLPLLQLSREAEADFSIDLGEATALVMAADETPTQLVGITASQWIISLSILLYVAGVLLFLLRSAICYISLYRMLQRGERRPMAEGITLHVIGGESISPFSWLNHIVVNATDLEESGKAILCHEMGHIRHHHTLDLLLTELCCILQWFNPAIWLMRRELQSLHEYEADEEVLNQGIDARNYQLLLIKKAAGSRLQSITNSLHQSSIKKRITMMLKKKSNPWARAKYALAMPVAILSVALFATPEASAVTAEISGCKVSEIFSNDQISAPENQATPQKQDDKVVVHTTTDGKQFVKEVKKEVKKEAKEEAKPERKVARVEVVAVKNQPKEDDEPFTVCEQMPQFPGGSEALMKFISTSLKYPAECVSGGNQGRSIISFIVEKDGSIADVQVMRSAGHEALDVEAIRVISSMPNWEPGRQRGQLVRVKYVMPINFRLDGGEKPKTQSMEVLTVAAKSDSSSVAKLELLILLDGSPITSEQLKQLDHNTIDDISVIKDSEAKRKYTSDPEKYYGIIDIKTKKN